MLIVSLGKTNEFKIKKNILLPILFLIVSIVLFVEKSNAYPCQNSRIDIIGEIKSYSVGGTVFRYVKPGSIINITPGWCYVPTCHCWNTGQCWELAYNYILVSNCPFRGSLVKIGNSSISTSLTREAFKKAISNNISVDLNNLPIVFEIPESTTGYDNQRYYWDDIYKDPKGRCFKKGNPSDKITDFSCKNINRLTNNGESSLEIECGYYDVVERFMYDSIEKFFKEKLGNYNKCQKKEEEILSDTTKKEIYICINYTLINSENTTAKAKYEYSIEESKIIRIINISSGETISESKESNTKDMEISINFEGIFEEIANKYFTSTSETVSCFIRDREECQTPQMYEKSYTVPKIAEKEKLTLFIFGSYPSVLIVEREQNIIDKIDKAVSYLKSLLKIV